VLQSYLKQLAHEAQTVAMEALKQDSA